METKETRGRIDVDEEVFEKLVRDARPNLVCVITQFDDVTPTLTGTVHKVMVEYADDYGETFYLIRHNPKYFAPLEDIRAAIEKGIEQGKKDLRELVDGKEASVIGDYKEALDELLLRFEEGGNADPFLKSTELKGWVYIIEMETTIGLRGLTDIQYELALCMKKSIGTALQNAAISAPYLDHHWTSAGVPRNYGFHSLSPEHKK